MTEGDEAAEIKRIVVPLDGSEVAERALPLAADLAATQNCQLLLFCAAEIGEPGTFRAFASAEGVSVAEAAETYLMQLADPLRELVSVDTQVTSGTNAPAAIVELTGRTDTQMVVMSRHGSAGPGRWLLGSVTDKIVRAAHCPVLVVPSH